MNKLILALTLLLASQTAVCLERDKLYHIGASTAIAASVQVITDDPIASMGVCLAIGTAKELHDINTTGFDNRDLIADGVGCLMGTFIGDYGLYLYSDDDANGIGYEFKF